MSEQEIDAIEVQTKSFLETPDAPSLVELYEFLNAEGREDLLASVLDSIRPIQHRITLIQADVEPKVLEALCRDPHFTVREVVAGHHSINEEVCFRLCEDQERSVRLSLRKNDRCHPVIRAALVLRERRGEEAGIRADHVLEICWQARRAGLKAKELADLIKDWLKLDAEEISEITIENANIILDVLAARMGKGPMPKKPRKRARKR